MKFVKSLSLPILSLALLLPMANVSSAYEAKAKAQTWYQEAGNAVSQAASKIKCEANTMVASVKEKYDQMPSFEQMRALAAQKLGFENKGFKAAIVDAKDAVITYSIRHPFVTLGAASAIALGAGFWLARKLYKPKKAA